MDAEQLGTADAFAKVAAENNWDNKRVILNWFGTGVKP